VIALDPGTITMIQEVGFLDSRIRFVSVVLLIFHGPPLGFGDFGALYLFFSSFFFAYGRASFFCLIAPCLLSLKDLGEVCGT
jgi:hypothetical protein